MADRSKKQLGALIQTYIRARQRQDGIGGNVRGYPAPSLDAEFQDRVDALGVDSERLLTVDAADVLDELQMLEHEAALEDARVKSAADRVRAQEETSIHGNAPARRRDPRMCAGRRRESTGRGRRRQRGQR